MRAVRAPAPIVASGAGLERPATSSEEAFAIGSQVRRVESRSRVVAAVSLLAILAAGCAHPGGPVGRSSCEEARASEIARQSARAQHFSVERMRVAKLVGPIRWERFVEAVPFYAEGHEEQRAAVGARSFFYVGLRYPPRPSTVTSGPGDGITITIPTGPSGHGVWIDSVTCELIGYLSGV
mgnify:CR=1 FL=1